MIRVLHIISGLEAHGAETMMCKLVSAMDRSTFQNRVISLTNRGPLAARLDRSHIAVTALGMQRGRFNPVHLLQLTRMICAARPHIVQTWMYHADLVGGIAAKLARRPRIVWGIHHSSLDPKRDKRLTVYTARACARLSLRVPSHIVCCSESSLQSHTSLGYAEKKMIVIPNGFDIGEFRPDASARAWLRDLLGVSPNTLLIGLVARFHPHKDHRTFIEAAAHLSRRHATVHYVLCGDDVTKHNRVLVEWLEQASLSGRCHLLGSRQDLPRVFAGLDVAVSSSTTEAFPLVIGESMACGVPCAVTDVGDSRILVGDTGRVVPAQTPVALASALGSLIVSGAQNRARLGQAARSRIEEFFALPAIVRRYEALYERIATPA